MKPLLMLGWVALMATAWAQDLPPGKAAGDRTNVVEVTSVEAEFDLQNRVFVYRYQVRVIDPRMRLQCELMTVRMAEKTNQIVSIVAEQAVQIELMEEKATNRAFSERAVYRATNDVVELTGNPRLVTPQGTLTSDLVILDRTRNRLEARGRVRMVMPAEAWKQPGALKTKKPATPDKR